MAPGGIDDHIVKTAASAEAVAALPRTVAGSVEDYLTPLRDLPASPAPEAVEQGLRIVMASLDSTDPLRRATIRTALVAHLDQLGVPAPSKVVDAAFASVSERAASASGTEISLADPIPWADAVDGAALLDEIAGLVRRFVVLPPGGADTTALWVALTYVLDPFDVSPILAVISPVKRCGKTTLLEVLVALTLRALAASNITGPAVYRTIEKYHPTLILDEADTFVLDNPELRGVLNSGHTRATAFVVRMVKVGDDMEPRTFSTWGPRVFALIGDLPSTLEDRSITLPMRRRASHETVERMRRGRLHAGLDSFRRRLARWARDAGRGLEDLDPEVPDGLDDRQVDNWRPLLAIAEAVGGAWPQRARQAARALCGVRGEDSTPSIQLLTDVRAVWPEKDDKISTADLIARLVALDEHPWGEYRAGRPLTARGLAGLLKLFEVKSKTIRIREDTPKGYERKDFEDPFTRYLGGQNPQHAQQANGDDGLDLKSNAQQGSRVADRKPGVSGDKDRDVAHVADSNPPFDGATHEGGEELAL